MCHFDQVWTTHYEPAKKVLFKPTEKAGQVDAEGYKPSTEKMLNSIKRALRIHDHDDSVAKAAGPAPPTLCAQSTLVPVEYNRNARTTTTLSFADGTMGRAYVTASSTAVSGAQ